MATHAHSTNTSLTARRQFGAGLLAVVAGSGIAAGAAASVADLVPEHPDARLLAICGMAETADRLMMDAQARFSANRDDRVSRTESDKHFEQSVELAEQAAQIPAQTLEGIRAKARLIYLNMNTTLDTGDLTSLVLRDIGWGS